MVHVGSLGVACVSRALVGRRGRPELNDLGRCCCLLAYDYLFLFDGGNIGLNTSRRLNTYCALVVYALFLEGAVGLAVLMVG